ncbi:hypothetical protein PFISCL1PPCAC_15275, partial [Pristionchus fissidentatus]
LSSLPSAQSDIPSQREDRLMHDPSPQTPSEQVEHLICMHPLCAGAVHFSFRRHWRDQARESTLGEGEEGRERPNLKIAQRVEAYSVENPSSQTDA